MSRVCRNAVARRVRDACVVVGPFRFSVIRHFTPPPLPHALASQANHPGAGHGRSRVGRALGYRRVTAWAHSHSKSVSSSYCSTKQRPACSAVHI
jgi:hypothetical protein